MLDAAGQDAPWAFRHLFELVAHQLVSYARSQGAWDPDGVVNEALLGAFRSISEFRGDEAAFRAWVFSITRCRLIDERRARARRPVLVEALDGHDAEGGDVEDDVWAVLGVGRVEEVLSSLSADQREVLLLRVVADLTCDEIAITLGKTTGAVKALQHRAIAALRRSLQLSEGFSSEAVSKMPVFDGSLTDGPIIR